MKGNMKNKSQGRLQIYLTADELREWNGHAKADGLDGLTTVWVKRIIRLYMRGELVRDDKSNT